MPDMSANDMHYLGVMPYEPHNKTWTVYIRVWECLECGALVTLPDTHKDFHNEQQIKRADGGSSGRDTP